MRVARSIGPREVELVDAGEPAAGDDGVVCRVVACGVCGSDVSEAYVAAKVPTVLGHEVVGEVLEVGPYAPTAVGPGELVAIHHHAPCGRCALCRRGRETLCPTFRATRLEPGGFAERVRVSAELARELRPLDGLDPLIATFAEPLGCVLRALDRAARLVPLERLLVAGAGTSGLLALAAARTRRAAELWAIEPRRERLARARALGAEPHAGDEVDVAFLTTHAPDAVAAAVDALGPGGVLVVFATPPAAGVPLAVDAARHFGGELSVITSWSAGPQDMRTALELLRSGAVDPAPWITHRLGLEETGRALELARSGEALKAIVVP